MDEPWVWAIILLLAVLLFGSKRLPDAARGIGRSLRIFKAETKGLLTDDRASGRPPRHPSRSPRQRQSPRRRRSLRKPPRQHRHPSPAPVETPVAVPVTGADQPDPQ